MIEWMHESMQELAQELRKRHESYPTKSPEYVIMTQDLSRRPPKSTPPLSSSTIMLSKELIGLHAAISNARWEFQRRFVLFYLRKWGRKRTMEVLGITDKNQYYMKRDELHAYILGVMDSSTANRVRTSDTVNAGSDSIIGHEAVG